MHASGSASIPRGSRSIISRNGGGYRPPSCSCRTWQPRPAASGSGTGIVTLPLELPVRVAEDAVVLDLLSGHRLEVGVGPGRNLTAFTAFGRDSKDRHTLMNGNLDLMRTAWSGGELPGGDKLYPSSPSLVDGSGRRPSPSKARGARASRAMG